MRNGDQIGLRGSLALLLRYARPHRRALIPVVLASLLDMGLSAQISLSFKLLIDRAIGQHDLRVLVWVASALAISVTLAALVGIWRDRLYARTTAEFTGGLRNRLFQHLQRLSLGFYSRTSAGDILSRFSSDLAEIEATFLNGVPWGIVPALDILLSSLLAFALDWRLGLIALLAFPLSLAGPQWLSKRTAAAARESKQNAAGLLGAVQENAAAQSLVKAYGLEKSVVRSFALRNALLQQAESRLGFLTLSMERSATLSTQFLQMGVLVWGGYLAYRGDLTIGTLAAFQAVFATLAGSLGYVAEYIPEIVHAGGGLARIDQLLAERPQVADRADAFALPSFTGTIEFKDVVFGYQQGSRNLDGVTLTIPRGASVAFVGPSGSGKSTVLALAMRFYDPATGAVFVDGRDLRSVSLDSWRASSAVVFQDNILLDASLLDNIRLANPEATDAEVERAAQLAGIHDFILSLPDKYRTPVGSAATRFSGGQRQRLAIARALLRDPQILFLDEATSALDSITESQINQTLESIRPGRTILSVTHRLGPVATADRIFFLEKGKVTEQGTHAELLESNGGYARLWKKQSGFTFGAAGEQVQVTAARLRDIPILADLDDAVLDELTRSFVTEHWSRDRYLIHEGDIGDKLYILVRGMAEVLKADPHGGHPQRLAVLQDGDIAGETALLLNAPRNASVRTLSDCTILSLSHQKFQSLMDRVPSLRWKLREGASIATYRNAEPEAATVRHDLLNLINQITGYSEMLIEDFGDQGETALASWIDAIHSAAKEIQKAIERAIPAGSHSVEQGVESLRITAAESTAGLLNAARAAQSTCRQEDRAQDDLVKIIAAAEKLRTTIGTGPLLPDAASDGNLLIVDDNPESRELLSRRLKREGYSVRGAASGREALEAIDRFAFDLVLLDVMMPDMDGREVLRRLKASPRSAWLPVIMTSALDEMNSVVSCIELGAEDYLTKPFDPVLLKARIGACLRKRPSHAV